MVISSLLSWDECERISCLAVQFMDYYKSDQARIGIGAWHIPPFFNVSNSFSLFVFMVGLDFKLIREEKH